MCDPLDGHPEKNKCWQTEEKLDASQPDWKVVVKKMYSCRGNGCVVPQKTTDRVITLSNHSTQRQVTKGLEACLQTPGMQMLTAPFQNIPRKQNQPKLPQAMMDQ